MSLASICQSVLAETGWPLLTNIANNSDATARQIMSIANTELRALSELFDWPQLAVEYNFNTIPGAATYLMPTDFRVLAPQSVFNKDQYYELRGSTGLQYWEMLKYGKLSSLSRTRFKLGYTLGVPSIEITPIPTGITGLVAVYYTNAYAKTNAGDRVAAYTSDTDTAFVPERYVELGVKWRFRRAKGLDFSAELAEYNNTVQTQFAKYMSAAEIPVGGRRLSEDYGLTPGYVRDSGFGV